MFTIDPIPVSDLLDLADSRVPERLIGITQEGALPPAFVAVRALGHIRNGQAERWCSTFYIRDAEQNVVGGCGFKGAPRDWRVEIGYAVAPQSRNRGIATSAIRLLTSFAFESGEVTEVLAQVNEENHPSTRVVQKIGFSHSGVEDDPHGEKLVQWVLRIPAKFL